MKILSGKDYETLCKTADDSPRQRSHHCFHPQLEDPIQRLVMVMNPATYVRPHRHADLGRWELFVVIKGSVLMLCFDDEGRVEERLELRAGGARSVVEIEGGRWHTLSAIEEHTTLFECKPGPYIPLEDKDFAAWAPGEGEPECPAFVQWFQTARPGDKPPEIPAK